LPRTPSALFCAEPKLILIPEDLPTSEFVAKDGIVVLGPKHVSAEQRDVWSIWLELPHSKRLEVIVSHVCPVNF